MADRRWHGGTLGLLLGLSPLLALAEEPSAGAVVREALQAGQSRLHELLAHTLTVVRRDRPQWLLEQSHDALDPGTPTVDDIAQLVVQQDRRDGADLLTLRYPLLSHGALRTYAGAGLNQATYFEEDGGAPVMLVRRNRQHSLGAAAEIGAEMQVSERLMVNADLRWVDLADDAILLRSGEGYVGADAVVLGLSVGWRFR